MKMISKFLALVLFAFIASAPAAFAQIASVIELTGTGTARVVPAAVPGQPAPMPGPARNLRMGDGVNQGETITAGAQSRLTLRFEDGQVVSLSPNGSFRIEAYTYNRAEPAKSNALFNLVSGGMRAITGAIGKARPESVTYKAGNATIGVRGTDVTFAIAGGNLIVNVESGSVFFVPTTGAPPVAINAGQGAFRLANGMVTVGNAQQLANAVSAALMASRNDPMTSAALGTLIGSAAAVIPGAANWPVTTAVMNSGNPAAQNAAATAVTSQAPNTTGTTNQATTGTGTPQSTSSGAVGTGGAVGGSGGGGGSTLPLCSSIVSPVVPVAGTNCRNS